MMFKEGTIAMADEGPLPTFDGALGWINSTPVVAEALRGKVVLVDFWTYTCINSLRNLPYLEAWAQKYRAAGLVVIGVHTPEFSFEGEPANVDEAVRLYRVSYPVAIDSNFVIWRAFGNAYWPADYVADGRGRIRYHHYGEGDYVRSERVIQQLLRENGATDLPTTLVDPNAPGVQAPADVADDRSDETYAGYARATGFSSPEGTARDVPRIYTLPAALTLNHWGLRGEWEVGAESAVLRSAPGAIAFRFHSRDLHVVLAPAKDGTPIRFRVTLDGEPPAGDHGADAAPDGFGTVQAPRLYQLIRQRTPIQDRTCTIDFLDPGVRVVVFTFG